MGRMLIALSSLLLGVPSACAQPATAPACKQQWVPLTGRVVDEAGLIPEGDEATLTRKLAALEGRNGRQLVVATIKTLQGKTIEAYSLCLANHWGVGRKGVDDGVVMLVVPNERKVRIEVGRGAEAIVTNAEAKTIIEAAMVPAFSAQDFPRGIAAGADALLGELQ